MYDNFPTEPLKIIKKNGTVIEDVIGLVSTSNSKIHTDNTSIDLEEGDIFERSLPNNRNERYTVINSGFVRGTGSHIQDHYQAKVEKITSLPKANPSGYIHVVTESGRVNINSVDNSVNIQVSEDTKRLFDELKKALETTQDEAVIESVEELRNSVGKPQYAEKYSKFIQGAANHMTIIAPFLPAISALLVG